MGLACFLQGGGIYHKLFLVVVFFAVPGCTTAFAFTDAWVLNMKAEVGGSLTIPSISSSDLNKLCAESMSGLLGFVAGGTMEVGRIWSTEKAFKLREDNPFSSIGVFFSLGISQGYAGQITTAESNGNPIDVYVNVSYTPIISLGVTGKMFFFDDRMAVGLHLGTKIICDTAPEYELYSSDADVIAPEVGTIIVDNQMMTSMNPFMFSIKPSVEYLVPLSEKVELNLGGYLAFNLYSPKYITLPSSVEGMLQAEQEKNEVDFDAKEDPLKSYFINSFDFGIILGMNFRL